MLTDEELSKIYKDANGLNPKVNNDVTTKRVFTAMRKAYRLGQNSIADKFICIPPECITTNV